MTNEIRELEPLDQIEPSEPTGRSLMELEIVIEQGRASFLAVGQALLEIRDERKYRDSGYTRFEDYCRERWGWSERHANRQIDATKTIDTLYGDEPGPRGPVPATEKQARVLASIPEPVHRAEVWDRAVEEHGPQPTARQITETADFVLNREPHPTFSTVRNEVMQQVREQEGPAVLDKLLSHITQATSKELEWLILDPSQAQRQQWIEEVDQSIAWLQRLKQALQDGARKLERVL